MSNISKDNNQFPSDMNLKQRKTNRFWNFYSKLLIRSTWLILILSSILTIGLTFWFLYFMQIRLFDQTDFFIQNGQALKNVHRIQQTFGNDKYFRVHQQMDLYPALDVIIKRKLQPNENINQTNMLNEQVIKEVRQIPLVSDC